MTPSLDELRRDPTLAAELPPAAALDAYGAAMVILAALFPRFAQAVADRSGPTIEEDRVLSLEEAAGILGIAPSTLQQRARTKYQALVIRQGRRLGFSARKVQAFIRLRVGR